MIEKETGAKLAGRGKLRRELLDEACYLPSLLEQAVETAWLSREERSRVEWELAETAAAQVIRYTKGESSSVPIEIAQGILYSISYCVGLELKKGSPEEGVEQLRLRSVRMLWKAGKETARKKMRQASLLLGAVQQSLLDTGHRAYQDTIYEIPKFFQAYDVEFAAQEVPCTIDYQLSRHAFAFAGVEFIYRYLSNLLLENRFCQFFSARALDRALRGVSAEYEELLVNLYEQDLSNALGCVLARREVRALEVSREDLDRLQRRLEPLPEPALRAVLLRGEELVEEELGVPQGEISGYMRSTVADSIAVRVEQAVRTGTLDQVFVIPADRSHAPVVRFQDGAAMEDELFRSFVREMGDCRFLSDKIAMIRRKLSSLRDLADLMEAEVFAEWEWEPLFTELGDTELAALLSQPADWEVPTAETQEQPAWMCALKRYLRGAGRHREGRIREIYSAICGNDGG